MKILNCVIISLLTVGMLLVPTFIVMGQPETSDEDHPVTTHIVQRGETLFRIAQDYGISVEEIASANGITDVSNIVVGQHLIIPVESVAETPTEPETHVVQPGETLTGIAELYDLSPDILAAINNLTLGSTIYAGQTLVISTADVNLYIEGQGGVTITHVVERGETLFGIAMQYGTTIEVVQEANQIEDPSTILVGQQLIVPNAQPPPISTDLPDVVADINVAPLFFSEGRSGRVRLTTTVPATVTGRFLGRDLVITAEVGGTVHTALIPVPMYSEAGVFPMTINVSIASGQAVFSINIRILAGGYDTEDVELPEELLDLVNPAVEDNELNILSALTQTVNPERYFDGSFALPAAAIMNEPYGTRRSYNGGSVDRYHTGADFAGMPGSPVLAAAPGRVVLVDTMNIRGISVVIDHGWGVYTNYAHLDQRLVELGQMVSTGDQIGTVGDTGRVTGAHLHWEVWLHGVAVDPMQWAIQSFP